VPLQNRVLPDGTLVAQNWRGSVMGNRGGRIHDPATRTLLKRKYASRRWICCVLEFKNRQRTVMGEGYTELFFWDEVSALAAGHRPCFECRRKDAVQFQLLWQKAFDLDEKPNADAMDKQLHFERMSEPTTLPEHAVPELPDGTMIRHDNVIYALRDQTALKWSSDGYSEAAFPKGVVEVLTPASIRSVLANGYRPEFHSSMLRKAI